MQIDRLERDSAERKFGHEYHARNPEKEDIVSGLEKVGRVIGLKIERVVGPAERGEGPEAGREPRIEGILVLYPPGLFRFNTY